ncbi:catechol 2,3-dioxygenase [Microterricola gilva]|uniref:Catechol 2,3-dioxygenase n=1 Tax=Microterricola gilva TaxID=393267 RepID=A0A4Q8ALI7_9MICO|nr:VOC family protein [Microterricola gilva]RZU64755.1 catechol 2,3-dioxygenase [Microterricola gilva]
MPRKPAAPRTPARPRLSHTAIAAIAVVVTAVIAGGAIVAVTLAGRSSGTPEAAAAGNVTTGPVSSGLLHADTRMGAVQLTVGEMPAMRAFYAEGIGLDVLAETGSEVSLGQGGEELIRLVADAAAPPRGNTDAGLYHSAILFPDAAALAASLQSIAERSPSSYQGSADHTVSQAFYLGDPEGNGVELYVDRPREEWEWIDGQVTMGSAALDPNAFIAEHLTDAGTQSPATMGHVHLSVGDLESAESFYVDVLGFDVTSRADGAIFMSAGGYHHHLAANTWNSAGAAALGPSAGLRELAVILADRSELDAAAARIAEAGLSATLSDDGLTVLDPWNNTVHLRVAA